MTRTKGPLPELLMALTTVVVLALPGDGYASSTTFTAPYADPFYTRSCGVGAALPDTCNGTGGADIAVGKLEANAEAVSPDDGRLPGGQDVEYDAGFNVYPQIPDRTRSVEVTVDVTILRSGLTASGQTWNWANASVMLIAWIGAPNCDCFAQGVIELGDLRDHPNDIMNETRSMTFTMTPGDDGQLMSASRARLEVRASVYATLRSPGLAIVGDTGRVRATITANIDRVVVVTLA